METRFTWDPDKAARNLRVHKISFDTACEAFDDPQRIIQQNYFVEDQGEQRYHVIGLTRGLVLILVVFVDRSEDDDPEVIHIISARKADQNEQGIYSDQFQR